ncbi:MAG: sigma-70 family RNA polymerase sigma factor [Odoribacteraceae bacterium]|jgi:RNA polymerase sigma factor (sigma-70 family)|nr:sigma-70 family RNA polymerase sigma factor [Odoribacteraceae bacterium]
MKISDDEILSCFREDRDKGCDKLFERYYRPLVAFADSFLPAAGQAEDLVQDVFYRFLEKKKYLSLHDEALSTYLFRAVRNASINKLRSGRRLSFQPVDALMREVMEEEGDLTFDPELLQEIATAIDRLPEKTAFILRAVLLERKRYKEVALLADVSINTVKTLLAAGLRAIREQFSSRQFFLFMVWSMEGIGATAAPVGRPGAVRPDGAYP